MSRKSHPTDYLSAIITTILIGVFVGFLSFFNLSPLVTILLVAIFFTILVLLINLKWGLFLILLIRPILDFSSEISVLEVGGSSINLASILGIVLIVATIAKIPDKLIKFKKNPLLKQWLAFLFILAVGILFSFNKTSSVSELIRVSTIFSLFVLGFVALKNKRDFLELTVVIIISMIIPSIVAFYQLMTNTGLSLSYQDVPNRLFGTFAHPNLFAFSLTLSIALSMGMFLFVDKVYQKWLYATSFLMFFLLLILTYTRGAWILFAFMILSAGVLRLRKFLFFSIIIFFSVYLLVAPIRERVNSITNLSPYSSISWRFKLWQDSLVYFKEAPIMGHGTGTAEELILERRGSRLGSPAPHNDFLRILLGNGVIGVVAFVVIFLSLSRELFLEFLSRAKRNDELAFLFLIFLCFSMGLYAASFGDNIINATALQWAFWAEAGGLLAIRANKNNSKELLPER